MKFEKGDHDWSDFAKGLSPKREKRYREVIKGIMDGLLDILKTHNEGFAINAVVPKGLFSVGVKGDGRVYGPFVMLTYDKFPGHEHLGRISTIITDRLPVTRVVYNLTHKVVCPPDSDVQFLVPNESPPA